MICCCCDRGAGNFFIKICVFRYVSENNFLKLVKDGLRMIKSTSFVLLLVSLISVCQGLYFHIAETERKCFIEEIPDETTVIGKRVKLSETYESDNDLVVLFLQSTTKWSFMIHDRVDLCRPHPELECTSK